MTSPWPCPGFYQPGAPHGSLRAMTPADVIAAKMLQQEYARLRERAAFFHGCADDPALRPESREASRRVADALGRLLGGLAAAPCPNQAP